MGIGTYSISPPEHRLLDEIFSEGLNRKSIEPEGLAVSELLELITDEPPPRLNSNFRAEFQFFLKILCFFISMPHSTVYLFRTPLSAFTIYVFTYVSHIKVAESPNVRPTFFEFTCFYSCFSEQKNENDLQISNIFDFVWSELQ